MKYTNSVLSNCKSRMWQKQTSLNRDKQEQTRTVRKTLNKSNFPPCHEEEEEKNKAWMFISSSNPILTLGRLSQRTYFAPAGKSGQVFCRVHCQQRKDEHLCFALATLQKCHIKVIELNWLLRVQKLQQDWFKTCLRTPLWLDVSNPLFPATDSPHKLPIPNSSQRRLNLMSHNMRIVGLRLNLDNLKPPQRPRLASGSGYASIWRKLFQVPKLRKVLL